MRDRRDLLAAFERIRAEGATAALATVMRVEGSAYRRPGARMLLGGDGAQVGLVSGGCLEADLAERARPVLATGRAVTVSYDARTDEDLIFGLGLGCEGRVEILLERVPERADGGHLGLMARCLEARLRLVLATVFSSTGGTPVGARYVRAMGAVGDGDGLDPRLVEALDGEAEAALATGRHAVVSIAGAYGSVEASIEVVEPFPGLTLFGGGPDARPLARIAVALGFDVHVVDHRPALARAEHFPGARQILLAEAGALPPDLPLDAGDAAILLSHAFVRDRDWLRALLGRSLGYLGVLGPRRRTERMLDELAQAGVVPTARERALLHAPVGLDIGAETPEEVALSILAEILAERAGRRGGPLRDGSTPIHGGGA